MSELRKESYLPTTENYQARLAKIEEGKQRKIKQYAGEGSTFLLVIVAGAIFVYRAIRKQLKTSQQQQEFMMAVTHELKTPIAIATLNLETIQKRKLDETQQQRLLQNTLLETNRLNALCNNMLISSQIEAGGYQMENEELNLGELVDNSTNEFINRYPQRVINKNFSDNSFVKGDIFLLQIMVNNLLDNALKYSPKEKVIDISLYTVNDKTELVVKDEGPGISETEKKKVFEKFYRTGNEATKRAKGTGLGLYLTRMIAHRHLGTINVKDNPQGGSIFTVALPAVV